MKKIIINSFLLFIPILVFSQATFTGKIMDKNNSIDNAGISGATVHWLHTNVSAVTNEKGWFTIAYKEEFKK
ncbi:carboxypeptidase-like regulatory domain-containing protein [Polaribacter filamentus]|uniref:carboxypeptidase-like regulatory domain-containing protein n=1 Tax=Polaribacter filamentus TaxID=53483 RepID=UPI001F0C4BCB|nr:carboxypeptidase-like regulatory domain-containing protein [Polaribacter filamentus]